MTCNENVEDLFDAWIANNAGGTAQENCGQVTWSTDPAAPILDTDFDQSGPTSVWFIASDDCGNSSSFQASFSVVCVGLSKEVVEYMPATTPGNFEVSYEIGIENIGNTTLENLTLSDVINDPSNLGQTFIQMISSPYICNSNAASDPVLLSSFNGTSTGSEFFDGVSGVMNPEEELRICFSIEVDPNATGQSDILFNSSSVSAIGPNGERVIDRSDNGSDADGDNGNNGFDDPTPLILPAVSAVKTLAAYEPAADGVLTHLDLVIDLGLKNVGNITLNNLDLFENLSLTSNYGPLFLEIPAAFPPVILNSTATVDPTINPLYDGFSNNPNIFDGSSGELEVGQEIFVRLRATIDVGGAVPDTIYNTAIAGGSGFAENGTEYYNDDISDSGSEFESNNIGEPGDTGGSNDPTCIPLLASVGDLLWKDLNGNGQQEAGEFGVEGVLVNLFDCNDNLIRSTTTDENGYYLFEFLIPGDYYIEFDTSTLPAGCAFTLMDQASDELDSDVNLEGVTECFTLSAAEHNETIDAGILPLAKIGDRVWQDCDGDGIQDPDELGLPAIEVFLYDESGVLVSFTETDANGYYLFDLVYPGLYYVEFETPGDYLFTIANQGMDTGQDSDVDEMIGEGTTSLIDLSAGECNLNAADAGMFECVEIGELVWFDTNENNVWDSSENGVNGLKVILFRELPNGTFVEWDFTYTGHKPGTPSDDGYFKFCAPPGNYYLEFAQPPYGMVPAIANQGNFEEIDSDVTHQNGTGTTDIFSVQCGVDKCDLGAGYYPMGTIGDFVWLDANQNGMRDPQENGVANVLVEAFDIHLNLLGSDNTDSNGNYFIDYLQATDVYLRFTPPSGYGATLPHQTDDDMDSDIDNSNGAMTTQYYNIVSGQHLPNVDAGLIFGVVPVEWVEFTCENLERFNQLDWQVASQIDVSHYEIERSVGDITSFTTIGKILSYGSSAEIVSYDYQDYDIERSGEYYYRIKQIDLDGNFSYSEVIVIEIESKVITSPKVNIYPNPLVDDFSLEVETYTDGLAIGFAIFDVDGALVQKQKSLAENLPTGKHIFMLNARDLAPGIYTMRVTSGLSVTNKKLIVVSN